MSIETISTGRYGDPNVRQQFEEEQEIDVRRDQDEQILEFLDSMDAYVTLRHRLSSTLRQGWLDIASARHSMGSSRISSALYDQKEHQAASVVQVNESKDGDPATRPQFHLVKWGSYQNRHHLSEDVEVKERLHENFNGSTLRHRDRDFSGRKETHPTSETLTVDSECQKLRSKSLSVFGALVSPKLRSAQVSFETALEILVEIANMQSAMQSTFNQLQQRKAHIDGGATLVEDDK